MSPGRYKIFLGMAAGVGKTYRMLQEGHAEADAGRDVAIGYLEPHRREETSAQARGLEVVLRRPVSIREVAVEEMDLPAVLRRRPELALIGRLRAGKIYPGEAIDAALNNFFRIENLAALREVSLRQVAESVEAKR